MVHGDPGIHVDKRHHFSVAALEECNVCLIETSVFMNALHSNRTLMMQMFKKFNMQSIENINKLVSMAQKQMSGRVADALLYLSKEVFQSNNFDIVISRQELADMTALSKESAIRILKQLKDSKIIELEKNNIKILKKEMLNKLSISG